MALSLVDGPQFAVGAAVFGVLSPGDVAQVAAPGFAGIEPYRGLIMPYAEKPQALKDLLDRHNLAMATCSNGGPGQSCDFIDPAARRDDLPALLALVPQIDHAWNPQPVGVLYMLGFE